MSQDTCPHPGLGPGSVDAWCQCPGEIGECYLRHLDAWSVTSHQAPSDHQHCTMGNGPKSRKTPQDSCPDHTQNFAIVQWTQNTLVSSRVISHHSDQDTGLHPALITSGSKTRVSPISSIHILYRFHAYYYCPISVSVLNWILNGGTALRRSEARALGVFMPLLCICIPCALS